MSCQGANVSAALYDDGAEGLDGPQACPEPGAVHVDGVGLICVGCELVRQSLIAQGLRPRRHVDADGEAS